MTRIRAHRIQSIWLNRKSHANGPKMTLGWDNWIKTPDTDILHVLKWQTIYTHEASYFACDPKRNQRQVICTNPMVDSQKRSSEADQLFSCSIVVCIYSFVMHHQFAIDEVEAVRLCFIWVSYYFLN